MSKNWNSPSCRPTAAWRDWWESRRRHGCQPASRGLLNVCWHIAHRWRDNALSPIYHRRASPDTSAVSSGAAWPSCTVRLPDPVLHSHPHTPLETALNRRRHPWLLSMFPLPKNRCGAAEGLMEFKSAVVFTVVKSCGCGYDWWGVQRTRVCLVS